MKRLLVTGSRLWTNRAKVAYEMGRAIGELTSGYDLVTIVHGGAAGADTMAGWVATTYGYPVEVHVPDWRPYGIYNPQAGFQRNQKMVDLGVDMCLAFIKGNSSGATDCARRVAEAAINDDSIHLRIFRE